MPKKEKKLDDLGGKIVKIGTELQSEGKKKFALESLFIALKQQGVVKAINELKGKMLDLEKQNVLLNISGSWWRVQ